MTVFSILADKHQQRTVRHPLDLSKCIRTLHAAPKNNRVRVCIHSSQQGKVGDSDLQAALAFIFCAGVPLSARAAALKIEVAAGKKDAATAREKLKICRAKAVRFDSIAGVRLPSFEYANLALLLPAAMAAHGGLLSPAGAVCACLPIMAPFSVPQVSAESWVANKRARAFHRCCALSVLAQGTLAICKFGSGDLVGGTFLALQTAFGAYSVTPDGIRVMPSYIVLSGLNGVLGLIQVYQTFHGSGVPLSHLPMLTTLPPTLALLTVYWGWQFCRELQAIGLGMAGDGPQDTYWVNLLGADIWPLSSLSPTLEPRRATERDRQSVVLGSGGGAAPRFSTFQGNGQRLGES